MQNSIRKARYFIEYLAFITFTSLLSLVSIDTAAEICAKLASILGPFLGVTKIARNNLKLAYSELDIKTENEIIKGLWDNFGRFIGEFPHIHRLSEEEIAKRVEIVGLSNIEELQKKQKPFLLFTAHLANWDFILRIAPRLYSKLGVVYRKANNPFVDKIIHNWRSSASVNLVEKGPYGVRSLVKSIRSGHSIAMLMDQKMNDGIEVSFFGKSAMTAPAIARFALQFNYPIIPMQIIRTKGSNFKVILYPALTITSTAKEEDIMQDINNILEGWIKQYPQQWFWFHNRWGK